MLFFNCMTFYTALSDLCPAGITVQFCSSYQFYSPVSCPAALFKMPSNLEDVVSV